MIKSCIHMCLFIFVEIHFACLNFSTLPSMHGIGGIISINIIIACNFLSENFLPTNSIASLVVCVICLVLSELCFKPHYIFNLGKHYTNMKKTGLLDDSIITFLYAKLSWLNNHFIL